MNELITEFAAQPAVKPSEAFQSALDIDPQVESKRSAVKQWTARISKAKKKWESAFKRMEQDAQFAFGIQRESQGDLHGDEYQVNLVLRNINQKVAALYAKNPTAEFQRRKRMEFQVWDGKMETLAPVVEKVVMGQPPQFNELVLMADYTQGMQARQMVDKVGETLAIAYQYQMDEHDPDFIKQMKALVRRACRRIV